MKNQNVFCRGMKISLLILVLLGGAMAIYGQTCGDVDGNGTVTIVDALKVAQAYVGLNPTNYNAAVADVDNNGGVDIIDALKIAQYYVGLITALNCGGTATATPVVATPTATPTGTPVATPTGATTTHLDNPYVGANLYVNEDWSSKASANGAPSLANTPSFVWIDRIAAIQGGTGSCASTGIIEHLDRAVAQGRNAIQIVVYDMPNRDCSASASNGELLIANDGVNRYKTEFIDPIVAVFKNYPSLRIICILESDSIPNLITNLDVAKCQEAESTGAYATCLQYGINQINSVGPNTYIYIDIAHSAWLGWSDNFQPFINKIRQIIGGATKGVNSIDGFVDNTANTLPWEEPFIPDGNASIGGSPIKQSTFYDWNPYTQEKTFVNDIRNGMISAGFPSTIGMIYDSGRSGWGGPNRPTAKSTSTDLNTFVNASKIDRRSHRGNWCNQGLAGIGARPQPSPATGVDAFVWVKPPGESDGQATAGSDPCDPNKTLDNMCKPGGVNTYCNCGSNEALAGAPVAGAWFQDLFNKLVANAYPTL